MKYLIIILIIAGACYAATYSHEPKKDVFIDPNGFGDVIFTIKVHVPREQYKAMEYMEWTIIDMLNKSSLKRLFDVVIEKARAKWAEKYTITQLKAKE